MDKHRTIPASRLLATAFGAATFVAIQISIQAMQQTGDFTKAAIAEVRNPQGAVILRGQFADEEDGDDIERKAMLGPAGADADAKGEAEVEYAKAAPARQEVEFSIDNVDPGVTFTFVIDGVDVATATADRQGRAEAEVDVQAPATNP